MEPFRELPGPARWVGQGTFLASLAITAFLERLQFRLRAKEQKRWWASNGRDVLNGLAFASITLSLVGVGFAGPVAMVLGALLLLAVSAAQAALGDRPHSGPVALLVAWLLGAPLLVAPAVADRWVRALVGKLFE